MTDGTRPVGVGGITDDEWDEFLATLIRDGEASIGRCEGGCDFRKTHEFHIHEDDPELGGRWILREECSSCCGADMRRVRTDRDERRSSWRVRGRKLLTTRSATYEDYRRHLASDGWKTTRRLLIEHYGGCVLCGETERLHIHHRTYERVGRERLTDLTVLCSECHDHFHNAWALEA